MSMMTRPTAKPDYKKSLQALVEPLNAIVLAIKNSHIFTKDEFLQKNKQSLDVLSRRGVPADRSGSADLYALYNAIAAIFVALDEMKTVALESKEADVGTLLATHKYPVYLADWKKLLTVGQEVVCKPPTKQTLSDLTAAAAAPAGAPRPVPSRASVPMRGTFPPQQQRTLQTAVLPSMLSANQPALTRASLQQHQQGQSTLRPQEHDTRSTAGQLPRDDDTASVASFGSVVSVDPSGKRKDFASAVRDTASRMLPLDRPSALFETYLRWSLGDDQSAKMKRLKLLLDIEILKGKDELAESDAKIVDAVYTGLFPVEKDNIPAYLAGKDRSHRLPDFYKMTRYLLAEHLIQDGRSEIFGDGALKKTLSDSAARDWDAAVALRQPKTVAK